ncbi:hypothetical protein DLAC_07914 [Tieghemostelium lacteum]|uniref:Ubiquitin-like domain-containing protein n=1 Tax=Tieghemostelium lacteum TaxID=361077 RepID=A0A151ZAR1_TIELA|nr:hypothetical protein DLAC_07914 [Tieghemostelium lacteum]|eukprot:KYQ91016.1 hypothetical protein DLAC_07914 [Tieghemostelium lacteum]
MKVTCPSIEKTYDIEVEGDLTLFQLKEKIQEKTGTPPVHQLIQLPDKKTLSKKFNKKRLSQLHLDNNSNILMIYQMAGGCDCCGCSCDICGCGGGCRCSIM